MSRFTEKAMSLRNDAGVKCNCAQTMLRAFAEDLNMPEEKAMMLGSNFGGGMKMGSLCGTVTSAAMIFGLYGMDDPRTLNRFYQKMKEGHDGDLDCAVLLKKNAERGGEKKAHCDAMICESIGYIEEILKEKGLLRD